MSDFKRLIEPVSEKELKSYRNRFKESLKYAKQSEKSHPTPSGNSYLQSHLFNMAYNAVSQRDEVLLEQIYADHQAIKPDDEYFHDHIEYNRACLRIAQLRFKEAIKILKKIERSGKRMYRSHTLHLLVDIYNHQEDYKAAAPYVHKYIAYWDIDNNKPNSYANYSGLGYLLRILANAGDFKSVIKYGLTRINQNYPKEQYLYFLVAQSYLNLKDIKNALKYYSYIFKRKIPYPEAYVNLSHYYFENGNDWDKAIQYLIKAIKACGTDPAYKRLLTGIHQNIGLFYKWQNDPEKAAILRRQMFEAMGKPVLLSDLASLFSRDRGSMEAYRAWLAEVGE